MNPVAKALVVSGVVLVVLGLIWHLTDGKIPFGRLPGDIRIENENSKIYIPITTCLLFSALFTLISFLFRK